MRDFQPNELASAIAASRAALPTAIDALCTTIAEVNGVAPERNIVEHVGRFWLLHLCDQWSNLRSATPIAETNSAQLETVIVPTEAATFVAYASQRELLYKALATSDVTLRDPQLRSEES